MSRVGRARQARIADIGLHYSSRVRVGPPDDVIQVGSRFPADQIFILRRKPGRRTSPGPTSSSASATTTRRPRAPLEDEPQVGERPDVRRLIGGLRYRQPASPRGDDAGAGPVVRSPDDEAALPRSGGAFSREMRRQFLFIVQSRSQQCLNRRTRWIPRVSVAAFEGPGGRVPWIPNSCTAAPEAARRRALLCGRGNEDGAQSGTGRFRQGGP